MPFKLGRTPKKSSGDRTAEHRAASFHAVAIRPGENGCQASNDASATRHLSNKPPRLPLDDCDRPGQCSCRYQHFEDRRDMPRRHLDGALPSDTLINRIERRRDTGRREDDQPGFDTIDTGENPLVADTYYGYSRKPR
jgi:hypothetical protein